MTRHLAVLAVAAVVALVAGGAVPAHAGWADGFEYQNSPTNHGWAYPPDPGFGPDPVTSTEQARGGSRSLKFEPFHQIRYTFAQGVENAKVSAWFYDNGVYGGNSEANIGMIWDGGAQYTALGKYQADGCFYIFDRPGTIRTSVPVSQGWHHFEWVARDGTVRLSINNTQVGSYSAQKLTSVDLVAGEVGMYVDDLEVSSVPEPASMALLATGVVGLLPFWRRSRRRATPPGTSRAA